MLRFVPPCLPTKSATPPSGPLWLHEIKHDGFRVIACKDGPQVRLYSRPGNDLTERFPLIVETLARLRCKSCMIDGEAVARAADALMRERLASREERGLGSLLYPLFGTPRHISKHARARPQRGPAMRHPKDASAARGRNALTDAGPVGLHRPRQSLEGSATTGEPGAYSLRNFLVLPSSQSTDRRKRVLAQPDL
jgi:ATP dependent DNA ligase domain